MKPFKFADANERLSVLCIGAHSDDIEIGAGATILGWIDRGVRLDVHWVVLSALGPRRDEARASAEAFLAGSERSVIDLADFKDGFFPYQGTDIKIWFVMIKDSKGRFPGNDLWGDGWGWALFEAKEPARNVATDYKTDCKLCHVPAKKDDWVYIRGYPVLKK